MNKKAFNNIVFLCLLIIMPVYVQAQTSISSPYSRYGLGELTFGHSLFTGSMAGTSMGFRHPNYINFSNPASYSSLEQRTFLFDGGAVFAPRILKNEQTSDLTFFSSLSHLQFSFPLMKNWGFSLGIVPYSSVGYKISHEEQLDTIGLVQYTYEGWGGLNNLYLGTGAELFEGFSIGANLNYFFGNIDKRRIAVLDTTGFTNTRISNKVNVSDVNINIGIQYKLNFKKTIKTDSLTYKQPTGYSLTFGVNGSNTSSLSARENILAEHFAGRSPYAASRDTVYNVEGQKTNLTMPMFIGGGVFLEKEKRWMAGADVKWQNWSDFTFLGVADSLRNSMRISFGGAIFPKEKPVANMLKNATVMLGAHYYSNYLELKNTPLTQYGISFGLSMPVRRTGTAFQVSFEVGRTGTTTNNLIEETYGKLKIGVSITERWFYRSKFE